MFPEFFISTDSHYKIRFRWTYIALPLGLFLLSVIAAVVFTPQMPPEIAYRLREGVADRVISLGAFVGWMVAPQVFFTLLSLAMVRLVMLAGRYAPPGETPLPQLIPLMGNMVALPQIVLFIALLEVFLYNAYQTRLVPLWLVTIIVLVVGGIVLAVCFVRLIRRYRTRKTRNIQE